MNISKIKWGRTADGEAYLFRLRHPCGAQACISNYGGIIKSFKVPDRTGEIRDIVLGYDTLNEYTEDENMFGATVGPIADRVENACFSLAGNTVFLPQNSGKDCLHSGKYGFNKILWDYKISNGKLILYKTFANGNWLLPGNAEFSVTFDYSEPFTLSITYRGKCDNFTAFSVTNHSYFTLNGGKDTCLDDILYINSSNYGETSGRDFPVCTGNFLPTAGSCFDFSKNGKAVGSAVFSDCDEIAFAGGIDHYFTVPGEGLREFARLNSKSGDITLVCKSDMPGLVVYTANGLDNVKGKGGRVYKKHYGICFETEFIPNGINLDGFKEKIVLPPGREFCSVTEYSVE